MIEYNPSKKVILRALLALALIFLSAIFFSIKGKEKTHKSINTEADYKAYEGEVKGFDVLKALDTFADDKNLVYISVRNDISNTTYIRGEISSQAVFKKDETLDRYINPKDTYIGTIDRDSKERIIGLSFDLKETE